MQTRRVTVDQDFLRGIQRAGWIILTVDEDRAVCACPRDGCSVKRVMAPGDAIPLASCGIGDVTERPVSAFGKIRHILKDRREQLCLTIKDMETIAGFATDHLAKFEKDDAERIPNAETFIAWAQASGYEVVLRPTVLSPMALRIIAESRDKLDQRRTKYRIHRERRSRAGAYDAEPSET